MSDDDADAKVRALVPPKQRAGDTGSSSDTRQKGRKLLSVPQIPALVLDDAAAAEALSAHVTRRAHNLAASCLVEPSGGYAGMTGRITPLFASPGSVVGQNVHELTRMRPSSPAPLTRSPVVPDAK